jgi:hypothetical protein
VPGELLDSQVQAKNAPGLTSHYDIAGRLLRVETLGEWETNWVRGFLTGFHLVPTARVDQPSITLTVKRSQLPIVPSEMPSFAINRGDCFTDGTHYYLR